MKAIIISFIASLFIFSITTNAQTFSLKYSFNSYGPLVYVGDIDGDNIGEFVEINQNRPDTLYFYSGADGNIKYSIFNKGQTIINDDRSPNRLSMIDFNGNGVKDFYTASWVNKKLYIIDPSSSETIFEYNFQILPNSWPYIAAVADFDNDGKLEMLISEVDNTYQSSLVINSVYSTDVIVTGVKSKGNTLPTNYKLYNNYPNPFNPSTTIKYHIPEAGLATINIYDIRGVLIRKISQQHPSRGDYSVIWDGRNNFGEKVSSNVYFYQLVINNYQDVKKMIVLK